MSARARGARALAAVAAVALLAACGGGDPADADDTAGAAAGSSDEPTTPEPPPEQLTLEAGSSVVGLPDGAGEQPADAVAAAGRTADDSLVYVVTLGSSTCPAVPDASAEATGDAAVEVTFPDPGTGACTADFVPATTVVALPEAIDPEQDLTVTIGTLGEVVLPAGSDALVWATAAG